MQHRDHKHEALRSGERRAKAARFGGTVNGADSAGLRLHFNELNGLAEKIFTAVSRPGVNVFRHRGRRRNRINRSDFRKGIRYIGGCLITVHSFSNLFYHLVSLLFHVQRLTIFSLYIYTVYVSRIVAVPFMH